MTLSPTPRRRYGFLLIAALLAVWELSARTGLVVSANWPPVSAVLAALVTELLRGDLAAALAATLWRVSAGYACGVLIGVVTGMALGAVPGLRRTIEPALELLRPIPAPAIIAPLILFLGIDNEMKISIVALTAFFPLVINTIEGATRIEPTYLAVARTFRRPALARLRFVEFPAILPFIFAGARISLGLALVVTVVSEMIAGASGVGYYVITMQYAVRGAEMYAAVFAISILGYVLNLIFVFVERRVLFWYTYST